MSTDRGRRRTVKSCGTHKSCGTQEPGPQKSPGRHKSRNGRRAPGARIAIQLAPSVRLDGGEDKHAALVLVCPDGKVQLNKGAAAILRLCDGSRNRQEIVAEVARRSRQHALAVEIFEFLDAARARGWIVEG